MDKNKAVETAKAQMAVHLQTPVWSARKRLAVACRILFQQGHDSGLAGQVTMRAAADAEAGQYYTQPLGLGLDEITPANLLRVDEQLQVLEGSGMPNPANRFHTWIYQQHPAVNCIVHTHPPHISALSMLGRPLTIAHMDSCMLFDDVAYLDRWPGIPVGDSEGQIISAALGGKRAALLAHHGLVIATSSVEEACLLAIQCERTARLQLLAESAGEIQAIDPQLAREAHDWLLQERRSLAGFHYYARRFLKTLSVAEAALFE